MTTVEEAHARAFGRKGGALIFIDIEPDE